MTSDKREKAIKYLTEEIRSLRMAPQINGCGPENWEEQLEIMETCLEAVRSAHFAEAGKMQPLTVEQLREVVGKPYWHVGLQEDSPKPHWEILDPFVSKHPEDYGYGKRWLAYAYHPAHIDREAWKPCEECQPRKLDHFILNRYGVKFCRHCGRPLTLEAWAELEKRVRGVNW